MRKKNQPYLIEIDTYRKLEHCGPNIDNNLGYREKSEHNKWLKRKQARIR